MKTASILIIVIALITTAGLAFCQDADTLINRGNAKYKKGDLDGAIADYNLAIDLNPGAGAFYDRGLAKFKKGDLDGAIADYSKAIELKPDADVFNNRGVAKNDRGDRDGAIADFDAAIELRPNAPAFNNRGNAKIDKGDFDGALADYSKAIELQPDYSDAYNNRGYLHFDARQFTDALNDFRASVALNSSQDYARFRVWIIQARLGEQGVANKQLQQYLNSRDPGKQENWPSKTGNFLAGKLAEGDYFKAVGTDNNQLCEAYYYAGSRRLIAGDKATAKDYFKKCLATGVKSFAEYRSAKAELKFLDALQ